jgi:glucosamine--fructose-6-phosphate aminotransferase (isomerizing)
MNSIEAMNLEIEYQVKELYRLKLAKQIDSQRCVMTGSGDSYVATSIASYVSNYKALACRPVEIILNPNILAGRELYIVSVSGNTAYNILAAKVAKQRKVKTTAITANPQSNLAKTCDELIQMQFNRTGILTSGTVSFLCSMLVCLSLVRKVERDFRDVRIIFAKASQDVDLLLSKIPDNLSSFLLLGDGILFPVACYGALKINEVLGYKSLSYSIEDFCHAPFFSINKSDLIIILESSDLYQTRVNTGRKLIEKLNELCLPAFYVDCSGPSFTFDLLRGVFFVQLLALKKALMNGITKCYFIENKALLKASSECIY